MNELIKKLAEQSGASLVYDPAHPDDEPLLRLKHLGIEKFADLIVRECASFRTELSQFDGSTAYGHGYENGLKDLAETIKEHFGVEE